MAAEQKQKTAYERLMEYEAQGAHMLIPSVISIGDIATGFALIVEPVFLKPHPKDKDVYAHDSAQYDYKSEPNDWKPNCKTGAELVRIHKQGFDRLAQAAKVDWLPAQIIRDPNHPGRMMASVEGMIRTSTGELYRVQDIAGMDLDIEMEKIIASYSYNGKFDDKKQWMVDRDFLQKKANQQKLCISGAKNRVIKQLLCLRNTYTVSEIGKPFVAVRIVPHLDMNDAYTRKRVVDVQIAAMAGIYGLLPSAAPVQRQIEMSGTVPDDAMRGDDPDTIDATTGDAPAPSGNGATAYRLNKKDPEPSPAESARLDFQNSDREGQAKAITELSGRKAYPLKDWLGKAGTTIEKMNDRRLLELYDHLVTMPDKPGQGEDIPFALSGAA